MESDIKVTVASMNNFQEIQHLFHMMFELYNVDQNVEYPYSEQGIQYLEKCIEDQMAFVAMNNESVVGFLTGAIEKALSFKTYQQQGYLQNLFILEAYRRIGIGKKLVLEFIRQCRKNNIHCFITDSDDTAELRKFYNSLGFSITGINYELKLP